VLSQRDIPPPNQQHTHRFEQQANPPPNQRFRPLGSLPAAPQRSRQLNPVPIRRANHRFNPSLALWLILNTFFLHRYNIQMMEIWLFLSLIGLSSLVTRYWMKFNFHAVTYWNLYRQWLQNVYSKMMLP
jgi:hypothetical protein